MTAYPSRAVDPAAATERFGTDAEWMLRALTRSDPLADAAADALSDDDSGRLWRTFDQELSSGKRPSHPALRALYDDAAALPAWFDHKKANAGGRVLIRRGPIGGILLGAALVTGYASPAGNKPLVLSGVLQKRITRRVNETARFVEAVVQEDGLKPTSLGFQITLKVRIMHARVRSLCLRHDNYDANAFGHPVNQHDMLATILLFSHVILRGFTRFGVPATDAEEDAYFHLWSGVGHIIGVDAYPLALDRVRADRFNAIVDATSAPPDADSRALTQAFLNAPLENAKTADEKAVAQRRVAMSHGLMRGILGDDLSDGLGLERNALRFVVPTLSKGLRGAWAAGRLVGADGLAERAGRRYWDTLMGFALKDGPPSFAPPAFLLGEMR